MDCCVVDGNLNVTLPRPLESRHLSGPIHIQAGTVDR